MRYSENKAYPNRSRLFKKRDNRKAGFPDKRSLKRRIQTGPHIVQPHYGWDAKLFDSSHREPFAYPTTIRGFRVCGCFLPLYPFAQPPISLPGELWSEAAMEYGGGDLLSDAMGSAARVVLLEDCVEAPAAFVLHLLLKRAFVGGGAAAFLALSQPFSHYDRVLRKMGCNLSLHRRNEKLHFFELQAFPGGAKEATIANSFRRLYGQILKAVEANWMAENTGKFTIVIDDVSLLEVAAHGSVNDVLDFVHYCVTLTSEMNCTLLILIHEDIYLSKENIGLLVQLRYIADLVITAAPLSTGLAADVHGQLSVVNKCVFNERRTKDQKVWNFHFKVKENGPEFFYPGSRH